MLEEQGLVLIVPIDKEPSIDLKERIKKTMAPCKAAIDDQYKKNTLHPFLETLILHIVNALSGKASVEGLKEYQAKIKELENELKLKNNTVNNCVDESKRLKNTLEETESKANHFEKRSEELSGKLHKIELLYKDSENRRSTFQNDYSALLEEAKSLRKIASEKFSIERKCNDLISSEKEATIKLEEIEKKYVSLETNYNSAKTTLSEYEKELITLRSEMKESLKFKTAGIELEKLKLAQSQLEQSIKEKDHKIGELVIELEKIKTDYVNVKMEYEEYQGSQNLIIKKNMNDMKEIRRQYAKEKDLAENLASAKSKLEKECIELKERTEILQRNSLPVKSVSAKEKVIVEALSSRVEMLTEENDKLSTTVKELQNKIDHHENESKIQLQLLLSYASKYTQDHLEEFKDA